MGKPIGMTERIRSQQLQEMVKPLVEAISPSQVYLIGSYARGTMHPGSDIDLIVIMPDVTLETQSVLDCWRQARHALRGLNVPVDILIYPAKAWRRWRHSPNHILGTCEGEGKLLYAA